MVSNSDYEVSGKGLGGSLRRCDSGKVPGIPTAGGRVAPKGVGSKEKSRSRKLGGEVGSLDSRDEREVTGRSIVRTYRKG